MKELTTEEKAKANDGNYKAYTELISRLEDVKDAIKKQNYGIAMDILYKPYPEFQITTSTELKESERIKQLLLRFVKYDMPDNYSDDFSKKDCLAWLEKKPSLLTKEKALKNSPFVEQKPADKVEPKFKVGDIVKRKDNPYLTYILKRFTDDGDYEFYAIGKDGNEGCTCFAVVKYQDEWELVERKPLFKQGDILYKISDGSKIEIIDIVADQYKFECGDEYPHYEFFGYIENNYSKELVNRDLNKEIQHWREHYIKVKECGFQIDLRDIEAVARHFANWQKEEPVSEVWHDANEEQPEEYRTVVVWNPTTMDGAVLTRCVEVYKGRIWAYIEDLLNLSNVQRTGKNWNEPVSEELEEASKEWLRPQLDKSYADYGETKMMELTHFDGYAMLDAIEFGAKWQQAKVYVEKEKAKEAVEKFKSEFTKAKQIESGV